MEEQKTLIELEDYCPIDLDRVKDKWDEILNIPNEQWGLNHVAGQIMIVNDTELPNTLRTVKLNMLPNLVITILDGLKASLV